MTKAETSDLLPGLYRNQIPCVEKSYIYRSGEKIAECLVLLHQHVCMPSTDGITIHLGSEGE